MEADDLPSEFDIVILGTGLTETIVAAAFSRIGLKVLHLDRNNYYGGSYANFNLQGIEEWKKKNEDLESLPLHDHQITDDLKQLLGETCHLVSLPCECAQAHGIKIDFHVRHRTTEEKAAAEVCRIKRASESEHGPVDLSQFSITSAEGVEGAKGDGEDNENEKPLETGSDSPPIQSETAVSQPTCPETTGACVQEQKELSESEEKGSSEAKESDGSKDNESSSESEMLKESEGSQRVDWTVEAIQDDWRKYCFDLSPRVLYCSGDLVELLIQSDVARYCEFRTVSRVLTILNDTLQQVPCSRADVFSSKIVSLIEKRLMMKFLQFAADFESQPDVYAEYKDKPFIEFLKSKKLTANIQHFVKHAIAMVSDTALTEEGLKKTQRFLRSLGRYGNTAFLFSLYGSGELPQAFSRLSAVFGGTYCLTMSASHLITDEEKKCCGVITSQGKKITSKYVVSEASYLPSAILQYNHPQRKTSRAIFITDKSVRESKDSELSLLNLECKDGGDTPVIVMELPTTACVCPKGLYVVHLIRESGSDDVERDFFEIKERLFTGGDGTADEKPRILWSLYFSHDDLSQASLSPEAPGNLLITLGGGDGCMDMERSVEEARQIFLQVCPDEEFLPKPPNPEDIIYIDDEEAAVTSGPGEFGSTDKDGDTSQEKSEDTEKPADGGEEDGKKEEASGVWK